MAQNNNMSGGLGETALPVQDTASGRDSSPSCRQNTASGRDSSPSCRQNAASGRDGSPSRPPCASYTDLPCRKSLSHNIPSTVPSWIADNAVFFITVNTQPRGENQLARMTVYDAVIESVLHRQNMGQMWTRFILLMPDHLHGLFVFPMEVSIRKVVSDWKRFLATQYGIKWQRDYFDHRIRKDESVSEKWDYIRMNPVRNGLVLHPDDWPFQWPIQNAASGRDGSPSRPQNAASGRAGSPSRPQNTASGRDGSPSRPQESKPSDEYTK